MTEGEPVSLVASHPCGESELNREVGLVAGSLSFIEGWKLISDGTHLQGE